MSNCTHRSSGAEQVLLRRSQHVQGFARTVIEMMIVVMMMMIMIMMMIMMMIMVVNSFQIAKEKRRRDCDKGVRIMVV